MAQDVFDRISKISSLLGLWTIAAIVTFLIILWRRIYYVGLVVLFTVLTRFATTRYPSSVPLAEKPERRFGASKMRYNL